MKRLSILLVLVGFGIVCVGCSGSDDVVDVPKPVTENNPNKFSTALEGGNASASDDAGKSAKGAGEGH